MVSRAIRLSISGAALMLLATPSAGADRASAITVTDPDCELHIFPPHAVGGVVDATQVRIDQGIVGNIVGNGVLSLFRIKDPHAIQLFLRDALPLEDQRAWLNAIDYPATLRGRGRKVVVHSEPAALFTLKDYKTAPRSAQTAATCYSELVFSGTYFEKSTLSQSLKTSYFYRDFARGTVPVRAVLKASSTGISNFPPDSEGEMAVTRNSVRSIVRGHFLAILNAK